MPTRRAFLASSSAAVLGALACGPALRLPGRRRWDLLVRGGTVFDGSGAEGIQADIAIDEGRIVQIAPGLAPDARTVIDASGLAVVPGFVDIHSHADGSLFDDPRLESILRQGITLAVVGQDGGSRAPTAERRERRFDRMRDFLRAVDRARPSTNIASLVGLGTIRETVIGEENRPATPKELSRMVALVRRALADGAIGASTGLEYTPGAFATRDELVALLRALGPRHLYATHMRNEDDQLLEAIDEAIDVARRAGCRLQISHLKTQGPRNWGKLDAAFGRIEAAHAAGLDIAFDRYPYVAYQTGLTNLFPAWSRDGGSVPFLARLADSTTAPRIRAETLAKVAGIGGWEQVMIAAVQSDVDRAFEGRRLGSAAAEMGIEPFELAVALLQRNEAEVGMVGFAMSEENTARILAHPRGMVCTDGGAYAVEGPARRGHPHPRGLGAFPRVLGHYVRERGALSLSAALHKMSGFPGARLRLDPAVGLIHIGGRADITVFDPATVADRATFIDPYQYPTGIDTVIVNGRVALREGQPTGERAGRALRSVRTR